MMEDSIVAIRVSKLTKARLRERALTKRENYDAILRRLISQHDKRMTLKGGK